MKTRGLFVAKVAGGQDRHHDTVPQLLRIQAAVYIARRSHPNAGQARAPGQMLWGFGALPANETASDRARLAGKLLTGRNGASADAAQALF